MSIVAGHRHNYGLQLAFAKLASQCMSDRITHPARAFLAWTFHRDSGQSPVLDTADSLASLTSLAVTTV